MGVMEGNADSDVVMSDLKNRNRNLMIDVALKSPTAPANQTSLVTNQIWLKIFAQLAFSGQLADPILPPKRLLVTKLATLDVWVF